MRFLKSGNDETLNIFLAINFLIDELQVSIVPFFKYLDRVLYYRRSHAKNSIISPNKNLAVIREKVQTLCSEVDCFNPSLSTESNLDAVYSYVVAWNPLLLDRSMYSQQQLEKLATYGSFCNSIYHDKKIMISQVLVFDLYNNSDWTSRFRVCCGIRSGR